MKKIIYIFLGLPFLVLNAQVSDFSMLKSINSKEMLQWDKGMQAVSFSPYVVMPSSIMGVWAHGYFTKDRMMMRNGYKSGITLGLALVTTSGLKYIFNRERPYSKYPNDIVRRDFHNGPYSFPSGHTTVAFATATALSMSYKKWYVAVPSYAYASLVGYSRMRLGVHYPSDVLGGVFIGIGSGLLTWFVDERMNGK